MDARLERVEGSVRNAPLLAVVNAADDSGPTERDTNSMHV